MPAYRNISSGSSEVRESLAVAMMVGCHHILLVGRSRWDRGSRYRIRGRAVGDRTEAVSHYLGK